MTSLEHSVIHIGAWRVDPALDELSKDGQTTKLEPKMMQLLLCLAAHPGQVVSVEQLLDEVWKDVVVTPDSVYHAVAALRRVLGDDSKDPSYIANVMRRGYRLIAPVVRQGQAEAPAPPLELPHLAAESQPVKPTVALAQRQDFRTLTGHRPNIVIIAVLAVFAVALAYLVIDKFLISKRVAASQVAGPAAQDTGQRVSAAAAAATVFNPPPHSIAVLPFVNISGDKEQEYFSEGLTEELLNSLSRINELQVAARTSSFSFQGEHPDISTVAHKLNVGTVLEGSVRRSANTVRISVQLVNGVTGFHLWSQAYDRNLGDVLKLQTEIATAVASALRVTLLADEAAKIELGGTHNPAAFDAYLRGMKSQNGGHEAKDVQAAIDAFTDAIRLDPNYALAYAARSTALNDYAAAWTSELAAIREEFAKAIADGRQAVLLAPELGEGHLALADVFASILDFPRAKGEYDRAVSLAPGNAHVLRDYGVFAVEMGHTDEGLAAVHQVVTLDPLNRDSHLALGGALTLARKYEAAIGAYTDALALDPAYSHAYANRGFAQYLLGDLNGASLSCEQKTADYIYYAVCLAITYDKLGRRTDAEGMLTKLEKWMGDSDAYQYAEIYAQWGDKETALKWLETAWRLRDGGLGVLRVDPLLDPLRKESRFQAIERELKFPD